MAYIKDTQYEYYTGNDFGGYQFISLDDIITQFEIAYVGENKIIPKIKRTDIAFHAMRALQELSFDTFKSVKAHQIDVPPSLTMVLPQDYVNYTKLSWVDSSGIKHPLYPTRHTSNPFQILQNDDGSYTLSTEETEKLTNIDFSSPLAGSWNVSTAGNSSAWDSVYQKPNTLWSSNFIADIIQLNNTELEFKHLWNTAFGVQGGSRSYGVWQEIDVSQSLVVDFKATAGSGAQVNDGTLRCDYGVVRVGLTTTNPSVGWDNLGTSEDPTTANHTSTFSQSKPSPNNMPELMNLGYLEWSDGTNSEKEITNIDVSNYDTIWVWGTSFSPWQAAGTTVNTHIISLGADGVVGGTGPDADVIGPSSNSAVQITPAASTYNTHQTNTISEISVVAPDFNPNLTAANADKNSSTWNNYKSITPSENNNDDYEDDTYWPLAGNRYGLSPEHAQANGSFYIDNRMGKINFSSNISGKTVILDYISDSLGTNEEMQVHKLAEDAMYKWIAHAILSTSSYGQGVARRFQREKFAAVRTAKLRLSNLKIEELTQILRGKSKHIKH